MNRPASQKNPEEQQPSTRDFCYVCHKAAGFCICDGIVPVKNRTRIVIVQHKCERFHHIGTVRIASLGLENMELKVVWPDSDGRFTFEIEGLEAPGLLYPGPGATDLATVPAEERPRELVLLDGTWRDVQKLYTSNPWLEELPRYSLSPAVPSRYRIRKEPNAQSISTIEAIVQSLGILEPETPGINRLNEVFVAMIDRQMEHIRALPRGTGVSRSKRRRTRARRTIPRELKGPLRNLVMAHGESVPWMGSKRALIRWSAYRTDDGSVFDQFLVPREGSRITDEQLVHMGLNRDDLDDALSPEQFERLWNEFLTPTDILVTWNKGVLDWLDEVVVNSQRSFFLKEAYCNSRGGKCGHLQDLVLAHGLQLPALQLKGRAAGRLAETVAMARYLNQLALEQ